MSERAPEYRTNAASKPDCYECIHRRDLVWSAHSQCVHPSNATLLSHPFAEILTLMSSGQRKVIGMGPVPTPLKVVGNAHGIKNGWFAWPLNFDPTWLEQCNGFTPKGGEESAAKTEPGQESERVESVSQSVLQRDERNESDERPNT